MKSDQKREQGQVALIYSQRKCAAWLRDTLVTHYLTRCSSVQTVQALSLF